MTRDLTQMTWEPTLMTWDLTQMTWEATLMTRDLIQMTREPTLMTGDLTQMTREPTLMTRDLFQMTNFDFWSFFEFCRPGVSPKYSYAPESVCPRFSDEFEKKMDHKNVKIADFTIKAHFWATHKFWTDIAAAWRSATSNDAKF